MIRMLTGSVLLAAAMVPGAAVAGDYRWLKGGEEVIVTTRISHADLDLSRPEDRVLLEQRVRRAAQRLCAGSEGQLLTVHLDVRRCFRDAIRSSRQQLARAARRDARQLAARGGSPDDASGASGHAASVRR